MVRREDFDQGHEKKHIHLSLRWIDDSDCSIYEFFWRKSLFSHYSLGNKQSSNMAICSHRTSRRHYRDMVRCKAPDMVSYIEEEIFAPDGNGDEMEKNKCLSLLLNLQNLLTG